MAEGLAEMGANIVLCARKQERCHQAAEELQQLGVKAIALACDVKSPASIQEVVDATLSQFGRIDVLINNAGISWGAPVEEMRLEDWNKVIETNLTGTFLCSQAVGKVMIRQGQGKIINIASLLSFQGGIRVPAYAASKGGVAQLTKALANEWAARNVQVNAIAPGYFRTGNTTALREDEVRNSQILARIPAARWGEPDDIAGAAVFLASPASDYITGEVLVVDGGWMAR